MILNRDKDGNITEVKAEKGSILVLTFSDKNGGIKKAFKSMNLLDLESFARTRNASVIAGSSSFVYRNVGTIQNVENDVAIGFYSIDIDANANFKRQSSIRLDELEVQ